ncbi:MAG TPA: PH domain-containing protein [Smithellaceae bacterium]|nr:PH domain-containing protein [Smithellaceae bacterium]HPL68472.1 PH domain-containing protein [Smithellaceae bacterium]
MGSYVDSVLVRGERVEYQAKLHWRIYFTSKAVLTLWISPIIRQMTSEFVITNKRIIMKTGLISRKTFEMNLQKIESVNVDQSFWGRLLGFGTVSIVGTGGSRESFSDISKPLLFRRKFQETEITAE